MTDPEIPEQDRDMLAAELVLGVLDGEDRLRAQLLQRSDPDFAASVEAWQLRLAPLLSEVSEVDASRTGGWNRLTRAMEGPGGTAMLRSMRRWRAGALASGAVAAALALVLLTQPEPQAPPPAQHSVAQLIGPSGTPLLAAAYDPASGRLRIQASALPASPLAPELWVIPAGGKPRSLGALDPSGGHAIPPELREIMLRAGSTLAVSLEPRSGIPHAAPTGEIIATGTLTTI